jgi:hypothetical protein
MAFIDLKSAGRKWEVPSPMKEERPHEFRKNYFPPADGFSLSLRISPVRSTDQRQFHNQELLLLGSVSVCLADAQAFGPRLGFDQLSQGIIHSVDSD